MNSGHSGKRTYTEPAEAMKMGMRRLAKGVAVITTIDQQGTAHAMTASAVTSLSDAPASLIICVNKTASLSPYLQAGAGFCVNVLAEDMDDIANLCAGKEKGSARFALGDWQMHPSNELPFINEALACFFCASDRVADYGTHIICIGKISEVITFGDDRVPLVYYNGQYCQLAETA